MCINIAAYIADTLQMTGYSTVEQLKGHVAQAYQELQEARDVATHRKQAGVRQQLLSSVLDCVSRQQGGIHSVQQLAAGKYTLN